MNWPHTAHNNTRESPRYICTIFTIILYFLNFLINFKPSITPLIFIFITYYYFAKKKRERPYFFKSKLHIYIYFIIFVTFFPFALILYFWKSNLYSRFLIFAFWYYQFCTSKNPIFSTHFHLGVRLLAWLLSPPLDSPFSPPGRLYFLPPPSLLYPTLWISLCVPDGGELLGNWLLAGSVSLVLIPPFILLASSISFLPLLFSV